MSAHEKSQALNWKSYLMTIININATKATKNNEMANPNGQKNILNNQNFFIFMFYSF